MSTKSKLALLSATLVTAFTSSAFAQTAQLAAETNKEDVFRWAAGGAGFAIAIAALGGTLAQGRATAAALEGISRNPGARPDPDPDDSRPGAHRVARALRLRHRVPSSGLIKI